MARQGHAFANADEVRVAKIHYKPGHEGVHSGDRGDVVEDVVNDGEAVGEVVVRGNIVMKEVSAPIKATVCSLVSEKSGSTYKCAYSFKLI